mgnify:FL=1|tara:strand:- start:150 stop:548 length:399 start_codon:yes stop_codon:yes gene_type:complete
MLKVTVEGTAAEIKEFWATHYEGWDGTLDDFYSHLTLDGKKVVKLIAEASLTTGIGISRVDLQVETKLVAGHMNGVLGGIGRSWARTYKKRANPFSGYDPTASGGLDLYHQVSKRLANEIMEHTKEERLTGK